MESSVLLSLSASCSVDSRNFEMWGQFPPMSEKCGGLVNKNGNLYLRQRGINFGSTCLSISLLAGLHKCYCMDLCEKKIEDGN